MLASVGDTPYNFVLLLHIVSVILGAGAAFLAPLIANRAGADSAGAVHSVTGPLIGPALFAAGVFGGALVGMSEDVFDFQQTWLVIAGPVWIVAVAAAALVAPPSYLRLPAVSDPTRAALAGVLHVAIAIQLVIMIWQPGL